MTKARRLIEDYPDDYNSIAAVFRSGVMALYQFKNKGIDDGVPKKSRRR